MAIFKHLTLLSFLTITSCSASSWYSKEQSGWLWYKKVPQKTVLKTKEDKSSKGSKPLSYREQIKKVRENLEEVQAKAILKPTLENVTAFQQAQETVMSQADLFQKMLMMAAIMERGSDISSPLARQIHQKERDQELEADLRSLSKSYGLFFLVKGDCPYCHQFAPVVKGFLREFPFDIKTITKDGQPIAELPEALPDNGTIAKVNPEGVFPLLLLVNPATREVIPVARGLVNPEQLKENFRAVIHYLKNQRVR